MKEYHKIETLFKREETGRHKLIIGEFRSGAIAQCANLKWQFTEKIDGTNIRIYWDGHKVQIGGRTDNAQLHIDLLSYLKETFDTPVIEQLFEEHFGEKEVYLFGEGYGAGIQKGGGYSKEKRFILFDVQIGQVYLLRENVEGIAKMFGVPVVPTVLEGTIQEAIDYVLKTQFAVTGDGTQVLEGVVGRLPVEMQDRFGNRIIVKIKKEDFEGTGEG